MFQMGLFNERHNVFIKYLEEVATQHEVIIELISNFFLLHFVFFSLFIISLIHYSPCQVIVNSSLARFLCLGLASIAINPLENRMIKEILQVRLWEIILNCSKLVILSVFIAFHGSEHDVLHSLHVIH